VLFSVLLEVGSLAEAGDISFVHKVIDANGPRDPWAKMVGDIDGDGFADIVMGGRSGPLVSYLYPSWTKVMIAEGGYETVDGEIGDVDGDGDLDVIMGGVIWYENPRPKSDPAKASWKPHRIGIHRTHDLEAADLDGDGDLDVVTRDQSGFGNNTGNQIYLWRQDSPTSWVSRIVSCPHGEGLTVGDIDDDGDLDIIIGGYWYENTKDIVNGTWKGHKFGDWHQDAVVKMADINQDGRADVVLTRSEGPYKLSWFEGPASTEESPWKENIVDESLDFAHGIAIADVDNDGDPDIVTAEMHQSERDRVLVYLNGGNGLQWTRQVLSTKGSHNLQAADIGNDGDVDIVGANWSGDYQPIEMWENGLSPGTNE
jgi:hypothetical protein